jgi:hypothetical protein
MCGDLMTACAAVAVDEHRRGRRRILPETRGANAAQQLSCGCGLAGPMGADATALGRGEWTLGLLSGVATVTAK